MMSHVYLTNLEAELSCPEIRICQSNLYLTLDYTVKSDQSESNHEHSSGCPEEVFLSLAICGLRSIQGRSQVRHEGTDIKIMQPWPVNITDIIWKVLKWYQARNMDVVPVHPVSAIPS
jgi:hypothetical protein